MLVQDKINHYLEFVESGQLGEAKPEFRGLPVLIHVAALHAPTKHAARFYELVKERLGGTSVSLEFDLGGKLME